VDPRPAPLPHADGPVADAAARLRAHILDHCPLAAALLEELTPRRGARVLEVAACRVASLTVVMENLVDTFNAAAVVRTCEGLGLDRLHVVEEPNRWERHKAVARSADNWIEVVKHKSVSGCVEQLQQSGFAVYAADVGRDCVPLPLLAVDKPLALVFGSEHSGLSKSALSLADGRFTIPMHGFVESFNVSVSAAVALWEVVSRRRRDLLAGGQVGDLDLTDQEARARRYLRRALKDNVRAADLEARHGPR
jgi:tRNA (guanosine-2'-O-)-methyltransferase